MQKSTMFFAMNAVMWGASYVTSKLLVSSTPRAMILMAGALLLMLTGLAGIRSGWRRMSRKTALAAVGLALVSVGSNLSCLTALSSTSSTKVAFLVQLSVVLTPLWMAIARRKKPGMGRWVTAWAAVAGVAMMTLSQGIGGLGAGDFFAVLNAFFFTLSLCGQQLLSRHLDSRQFAAINGAVALPVYGTMWLTGGATVPVVTPVWLVLMILTAGMAAATVLLQAKALQTGEAESAAMVYTLEPVTAMILGAVLLGERISDAWQVAGMLTIFCTVMWTIRRDRVAEQPSGYPGAKAV